MEPLELGLGERGEWIVLPCLGSSLGFVPSAELVLCKFWVSLGAGQTCSPPLLQGLKDPAKEITSFTHTHAQHCASAQCHQAVSPKTVL